jgi:hypothetical protein
MEHILQTSNYNHRFDIIRQPAIELIAQNPEIGSFNEIENSVTLKTNCKTYNFFIDNLLLFFYNMGATRITVLFDVID